MPLIRNTSLFIIAFAVFLILLYPPHTNTLTVREIYSGKLPGFQTLYKPTRTTTGLSYSWTKAQGKLFFSNVNRKAPLKVTLTMNLDRPDSASPAQVTISELKGNAVINRGIFKANPGEASFRNYSFDVPADPEADTTLGLELESSPTKIPDVPTPVGVQLKQMQVEVAGNPYSYLVWPQPYLLAIALLLIGLIYWCCLAQLDWLETNLFLLPFALIDAALMSFLIPWSWLLLVLALVVLAMAALWQIRKKIDWKQLNWLTLDKTQQQLLPILLAGLALGLSMVAAPSFIYDTRLFLGWSHNIHILGPFDIYHHISNLDYPPFIVYILWIYGWLLTPFNLSDSLLAFKIFMLLCAVGVIAILWLIGRLKLKNQLYTDKMLIVVGLSTALLFNPAVWGQVDALLGLMLLITFWLIYCQRPIWAGGGLGLLLLFKPQAWLLLPLLAVLIFKKSGWRRGILAGIVGLSVTLILAVPAFGGDFNAFLKFWSQPSLAGTANNEAETGSLGAFNLLWLSGFDTKAATNEITWLGFGLIAIIYLLVLARTTWKEASAQEVSLGAAVLMVAFFFLSIKMRERYLYYALPLLAWACLYNRRLIKPYLVLNVICLVNTLYGYMKNNHQPPPTSFYVWPQVIQPMIFSWLTFAAIVYLLWLYIQPFFKKPNKKSTQLKLEAVPGKLAPE